MQILAIKSKGLVNIDYKDALKFISNTQKFGSKLGLENIKYLLGLMGNPQDKLKFIHIAGTNGKGSVSAMCASILKEAGYKTGLYISPFVIKFNERISINGNMISDEDIAKTARVVHSHIKTMIEAGKNHPTEFEIITAMAFYYFAANNCDYVVLEVGLGGRLDATNIIKNPLVSVITSISFDHTKQLGDTLDKIAYEKCGIIKQDCNVVSYPAQKKEALEVIKQVCSKKNSSLTIAQSPSNIILAPNGNTFDCGKYKNIKTRLAGEYQAYNGATVIAVTEVLKKCGIAITDSQMYLGIQNAFWPGRFEILKKRPMIILDGAHNLSGAVMLKDSLLKIAKDKKIHLVMGMLKDKEYKQCSDILSSIAFSFTATSVNESHRTANANEISKYAKCKNIAVIPDAIKAVDYALSLCGTDDVICVAGSLYLVSAVRNYIINKLK